ncbi:MAG: hypothetical protein VCD00_16340 [Candidatus Hydrogenedentota bacterium]
MSTLIKIVIGFCVVAGCCLAIQAEPVAHDSATCASDGCCLTDASVLNVSETEVERLVCTLASNEKIERRKDIRILLSKAALGVDEIESGYAITFATEHISDILEFIQLERECCTFFHFSLDFPPKQQPIVLSITGPDGAKDFLEGMISEIKSSRS